MGRIFKSDKISIDITDENGQKALYTHLRKEYRVSENQVLIDENNQVWLTNKVGEKFAMVGVIN